MELDPAPLEQLLEDLRVTLRDAPPSEDYGLMRVYGSHIEEHFVPLPQAESGSLAGGSDARRKDSAVTMTEELLVAACDAGNYRIGTLPEDSRVVVVCRAPQQPVWQIVGRYHDYESAVADARRWRRLAGVLRNKSRRIFIIEHVLLRDRRGPRADDEAAGFDYGLTATAVVCLPGREANDPEYREYIRSVIRRNTPAHIVVHTSFLRLRHAGEFEKLHAQWRQTLAAGNDRKGLEKACQELREFLLPSQS